MNGQSYHPIITIIRYHADLLPSNYFNHSKNAKGEIVINTQFFITHLMIDTASVFPYLLRLFFPNLMNDFLNLGCMIELSLFKDLLLLGGVVI